MQPDSLVGTLQAFLAANPDAVVVEDGATLFDLRRAHYSVAAEHGKCVLHLWSDERNVVRRILDLEERRGILRLDVLRFGQSRTSKLDICTERDRRLSSVRTAARAAHQHLLRRMLERHWPDYHVVRLSSSMDLERSFGPVYTRGMIRKGSSSFAILGVNAQEPQASIDATLTFGILWLDDCRRSAPANALVEGLKLFIPRGAGMVVRERMAHLNSRAAKWQLYELGEREQAMEEIDTHDRGNLATRLAHSIDEAAARQRFATCIECVTSLCREAEVVVISPAEIAFRYHGLEFARARLAAESECFRTSQEIVFGIGQGKTLLDDQTAADFSAMLNTLVTERQPEGAQDHPYRRLHPERWLESLVIKDVRAVDRRLESSPVYSQVPAFSAADRAMIDVLAVTRESRLAVLELKAEEDIHLPLQGVDYWSRVTWHHARGEFQRFGYFAGRELAPDSPLLILVAPALHVHPATDTLLRYLSPEIEWVLVGIDEHWRQGVRGVFRKRPEDLVKRGPIPSMPPANAGS